MTVKATIIILLLTVVTINTVPVREIPKFLHICQTNDTNYETCVINSIEYLKPYLKVGIPEYNIPLLEPLKLQKLLLSLTSTLQAEVTDVLVYGASNFKVNNLKIFRKSKDIMYFTFDVQLPNIHVEGKYEIDGKLLLLPITGFGPVHGNFSNCLGACKILVEIYKDEDNIEKLRIKDFKMKITVGDGKIKLNNLFNGEQVLGDIINSTINNNFDVFSKELLPYVEKALSNAFSNIGSNIIQQFSYAQLFPGA